MFRRLEERQVDLAIAIVTAPVDEAAMEVQLLYSDPVVVIAATKNPWSRRRNITLADLMNEPWTLIPPGSMFDSSDVFRSAGLDPPKATVLANSVLARLALVAKGRFITITSESIFRFAAGGMALKVLPIPIVGRPRPVGIVTLKNCTLTPVAQLFIDCAREVAKPLTVGKNVPYSTLSALSSPLPLMAVIGEVPPVLAFLTKGRFGAARPFPPGPWTEHS